MTPDHLQRLSKAAFNILCDYLSDEPQGPVNILVIGAPRGSVEPLMVELDARGLERPAAMLSTCRDMLRAANCMAYAVILPVTAGATQDVAGEAVFIVATDGLITETNTYLVKRSPTNTLLEHQRAGVAPFLKDWLTLLNATA